MKKIYCYIKKSYLYTCFLLFLVITITPSHSFAQFPQPSCVCAYCGYPCGSGHASTCRYSSNSSGNNNTNTGPNWIQAMKEKRAEQQHKDALMYNNKGNDEYRKKNWAEAVKYYKKALKRSPDDGVIRNNLKNAQEAYDQQIREEKKQKDAEKRQREYDEEQRKQQEEQIKKESERKADLEKANKEAVEKKLKDAAQKIFSLQQDISRIQATLKVYSKSLHNNDAEFDKWRTTVDESCNSVIENSKGYLAGMFIKYNLLGALKKEEQKIIFNKLRGILGNPNPELQKWLVMVFKSNNVNPDKLEDIIDRVNLSGDLAEYINVEKGTMKHNLDALLMINSLIESFNLGGYKDYIKNIARPFGQDNMPGDYFEQAKMIGATYADLSAICYSWFMINKLTGDNEAFAEKIRTFSFRMQYEMKQIDCLKKCIKEYSSFCIEKCTGVSRLSTPPPPLQ